MKRKQLLAQMLAAALGITALAAPVNVFAAEDDFAVAMEAKFAEPEMANRPYARWWLAEGSHTDETLRESVKELYEDGFGGVEFVTLTSEAEILDDATYGWGSPEWIHDTKVIIEECKKYGMSVSMTGGTYWATANLPTILPDQQEASQELGYMTVNLKREEGKNTSYSGELPQCTLPGAATKQMLVSVIAAKVEDWGIPATVDEESGEVTDPGVKTVVNTDSMKIVTDLATQEEDGSYSIDYTAEDDSDYALFAFYQYGTSERYAAANTGYGYTINYFDPAGANALMAYWDENVLTEDVMELISEIDEASLYMDSLELMTEGENSTKQLWCTDMLGQFKNRRGYDIEKYIPLLIRETPDTLKGMGQHLTYVYDFTDTEEIDINYLRNDFFQTETELYQENCLDILHNWLNEKGMYLRAENSYGKTFEVSQTVSSVDYLETESFEFAADVDSYRNFTGAAHVYDKRLSSESGASINTNYLWNNGYYRQIFYTQYAAGIQKTVTHGYSSEYGPDASVSWPGYEGMTNLIAERFNKRQPASIDYPDVNTHLSRIQKALEEGVPQVDIAMLRTDYYLNNLLTSVSSSGVYNNALHNDRAYYWTDLGLQDKGYTYDYFSSYTFLDDEVDVSDGMINSDGVAYKAVVIMEDELLLDAAKKLQEAAQSGLPVLFVNNVVEHPNNSNVDKVNTIAASTTGCNDGLDDELAAVVQEMKALDNVKTVDSCEEAMDALVELGVTPRAENVESNHKLLTNMRKADDATYLYVYHYMYEDEEAYSGQIAVEGNYQPYILDTWTGEVSKVTDASCKDGKTILNVSLEPGEVEMYILDPAQEAAAEKNTYESSEMELTGWNLTVDSYTPGDKVERTENNEETGVTTTEVTYETAHTDIELGELTELVPWKELEAVGDSVSGVGTYTTTFTIPEDFDTETGKVVFKADSFNYGTAMIMVNDQKVPVNMDTATADISKAVVSGENTISVRVTSSLCNVARGYDPIFWLTQDTEPADYGMTGKTTLTLTANK
ncbi:MAG: glycosyl hydrolase [Eubacteriales bacterium]|nr:glycosyl hydrolase [Eubacteriales bacterium]